MLKLAHMVGRDKQELAYISPLTLAKALRKTLSTTEIHGPKTKSKSKTKKETAKHVHNYKYSKFV